MNIQAIINPRIRNLKPSATLAINETSRRLAAEGRRIYRLGLGQSPFPVPDFVVTQLRAQAHQKAYLPARGLPELCAAITDHLVRTEGVERSPDHVLVGPGTKELLFLLQLTCEAELLLPTPSWVSYAPQAAILGRDVSWLTSDATHWGLSPQALDAHCQAHPGRTRLLILNYPNNPSGHSYTPAQLIELATICRRHKVLVLSDEIYSGVHYEGGHQSLARHYPEGTIVSNGLSKWCGAGGWRLGWLVFPAQLAALHQAMTALVTETFTSVNSPAQHAAIAALADTPAMADYLQACRCILQALAIFGADCLRRAGANVADAHGGFYLFPRFSALKDIETSAQLCQSLLDDTGVAVLPGSDFGLPAQDLAVRLAFVDFDGERALTAAYDNPVDERFLRKYCTPTVAALEALAAWVVSRRL